MCLKALTASGKLNDTHTEVIGKALKSASNEVSLSLCVCVCVCVCVCGVFVSVSVYVCVLFVVFTDKGDWI